MKYVLALASLIVLNGCGAVESLRDTIDKADIESGYDKKYSTSNNMHKDLDSFIENYNRDLTDEENDKIHRQNVKEGIADQKDFYERWQKSKEDGYKNDGEKLEKIFKMERDIYQALYSCPKGGVHDEKNVLCETILGYNRRSHMTLIRYKYKCSKCRRIYHKEKNVY